MPFVVIDAADEQQTLMAKEGFDLLQQIHLITFKGNHIIRLKIQNALRESRILSHVIDGHQGTTQRAFAGQSFQRYWNSSDFV